MSSVVQIFTENFFVFWRCFQAFRLKQTNKNSLYPSQYLKHWKNGWLFFFFLPVTFFLVIWRAAMLSWFTDNEFRIHFYMEQIRKWCGLLLLLAVGTSVVTSAAWGFHKRTEAFWHTYVADVIFVEMGYLKNGTRNVVCVILDFCSFCPSLCTCCFWSLF